MRKLFAVVTILALSLSLFNLHAEEIDRNKYYPVVVIKKDGTKVEEFTTIGNFASTVGFITSPAPKFLKEGNYYALDEIKCAVLTIDENTVIYKESLEWVYAKFYVEKSYKKTNKIFARMIEAGDLELFAVFYEYFNYGKKQQADYYCRRKGEPVVGKVASVICNSKGERCKVSDDFEVSYKYLFGDYPELCKQIETGKLTGEDFLEIVREYNRYKAEKNK